MGTLKFLPSGDSLRLGVAHHKGTGILVQVEPNSTGTGYEFVLGGRE